MMQDEHRDDSLDSLIRSRRPSGRSAVDVLNSAVPTADAGRRAALEERLLARVHDAAKTERNRPMLGNPAVRGPAAASRRLRISTSLLLVAAVTTLCAVVVVFANLTPPDDGLPAVAPLNQEQDESPTPIRTSTPLGAEQTVAAMPTDVPALPERTPTMTSTPVGRADADGIVYDIVHPGDTFAGIAFRNNISIEELLRLNGLDSNDPLRADQRLIVGIETTATPIGFVPTLPPITATPIPLIDRVPGGVLPPMLDSVAPRVWIPGRSGVSEREANGVMVAIPFERFAFMDPPPHFTRAESQPFNLFTVVGVPPETTIGAVGEGGDLAFAWVAVAQNAYLMQADENGIVVWVTLEQGIVLNWLLHDTTARLYYEPLKE